MFFNIPHHRWMRAIAFVLNTLGLIIGISVGIWLPVPGLLVYGTGAVGGAIALISCLYLTHRFLGPRLPLDTIQDLAFLGILQGLIFTGLLIHVLPPFYATWNQPQEPIPVAIAQLPTALPAYVSLTGYPQTQLAVEGTYRPQRTQSNRHPRTLTVTWVPLVAQDWRPPQAVQVMVERQALGRYQESDRPVTVTGMLFSLHPKDRADFVPADMTLYLSDGVGVSDAWLRRRAEFQVDPDQVYLLRDLTPAQSRTVVMIVSILVLVIIGAIAYFTLAN
ncbi:MAG: hypothetical protein IGR80_14525 [Synechococcales cyanobacterium K44_A2020_017]|nr:hypothetical protein [Synechococcales cyanobacterium K32_A2020_035]MBF2095959.1 hypothetical protein [Synechococcales cyanobacterium K44_A2020_017]